MDQVLRDVMIELGHEELEKAQTKFAEGNLSQLELSLITNEIRDVSHEYTKSDRLRREDGQHEGS